MPVSPLSRSGTRLTVSTPALARWRASAGKCDTDPCGEELCERDASRLMHSPKEKTGRATGDRRPDHNLRISPDERDLLTLRRYHWPRLSHGPK